MKVRPKKATESDAVQWNGHPEAETSPPFPKVRHWAVGKADAQRKCPRCEQPECAHGYATHGGTQHRVCPGDYLVIDGDALTLMRPDEFNEKFEAKG